VQRPVEGKIEIECPRAADVRGHHLSFHTHR
jgi:hypothetical protein